jgi:hypothetical protein
MCQWQAKEQDAPVDMRKSKRHGPPLFLVQLVITIGIIGALAAAVIKCGCPEVCSSVVKLGSSDSGKCCTAIAAIWILIAKLLLGRYDGMMANGAKLEKAIIQVAEKVQLPKSPAKDV